MPRRKSFKELKMRKASKNVKVQMLIEYTPYKKDDIVTMDNRKAKVLIQTGAACIYVKKE